MSNVESAGRGSKSNYSVRPIEDYAIFAMETSRFYDYYVNRKKIMAAYNKIYDVVFELNMSVTKKVNLFKSLTLNLYTMYPEVLDTNIDDEISKIAKMLKRRIRRKH